MIPWVSLAEAAIPGGGRLSLRRRGDEFSIAIGGYELMNSRRSGSERALATETCARLAGRRNPRLLVGGLGMGFTLREALARLGPDAAVVVAELVPEVVAWARGPLADLFAGSLADPRVAIVQADVGEIIAANRDGYDAILLDVDNGPAAVTVETNAELYTAAGLAASRAALRAGGVLAVWSAAPNAAFAIRLRHAGFAVDELRVRANGTAGDRHVLWLATAPAEPR